MLFRSGPVTRTLIPMAALDDIVGCVIFFTTLAVITGHLSAGQLPPYMVALVVVLPLVIGVVTGLPAGVVLKKERNRPVTLALLIFTILIAAGMGFFFNNVILPRPVLKICCHPSGDGGGNSSGSGYFANIAVSCCLYAKRKNFYLSGWSCKGSEKGVE